MGYSKNERSTQIQFVPQRYLRRGVFSSVDLSVSAFRDVPESVCIVRLPEHIAKEVNELFEKGEKFPFGIQPTPFEDFRIFDVHILDQDYVGILVDLPCNIEVYKSLDCESMFKSTNLSQMLYIYDARKLPRSFIIYSGININEIYYGQLKSNTAYLDPCFVSFIKYLKEVLHWEWPSGLLPASKNIRSRKYRNNELFDINEVVEAEQEILDRVSMPSQDMVTIEIVPRSEMNQQIHLFKNEREGSPFQINSFYNKNTKATCMGIIGKDDSLRDMISRFKREDLNKKNKCSNNFEFDEIQSDISDVIFRESSDDENSKQNKNNISTDISQQNYSNNGKSDQSSSSFRVSTQDQTYAQTQTQTQNGDNFLFQNNDQQCSSFIGDWESNSTLSNDD
ncbi:transcription factor TAF7p TAFII55 [Cryptosporidium bovis]|uniref:transcription factor TAF7p TAFII55 n=1 Tax=Cryptosporidium bovis TaxID=310047 RepID=UPI00351A5996|nr:transcription factor TAF7p TAFII55 [Cryptosporidium bovis]